MGNYFDQFEVIEENKKETKQNNNSSYWDQFEVIEDNQNTSQPQQEDDYWNQPLTYEELHPVLSTVKNGVNNIKNGVSNFANDIQTGLNKYGEAQALNGNGYSQMYQPDENGVLKGGVQKKSLLNDQRYWLKTKANNFGDTLLRIASNMGNSNPYGNIQNNTGLPTQTQDLSKESPIELKVAGSRADYQKLKEYRRNPDILNQKIEKERDDIQKVIDSRIKLFQKQINNGEITYDEAVRNSKALIDNANGLLKLKSKNIQNEYNNLLNNDYQRKIQNIEIGEKVIDTGFWTTMAYSLLSGGVLSIPSVGGKAVTGYLKKNVENQFIKGAVARGMLEADAKAMVKEAGKLGLIDLGVQNGLKQYSDNFVKQGISNAATRLMGKIATNSAIAGTAGAIDMGLLGAGTNEYAKYLGVSDTPTWQAGLEGTGSGALFGGLLGGGMTALEPALKAIGKIPLKTTYEPKYNTTEMGIYKANPNIKYGYANGNGFYTTNPNVNIDDIAPNTVNKQQEKLSAKEQRVAEKNLATEQEIKDKKIAELEKKINSVEADTSHGKKYQAQLDELRGSDKVSDKVEQPHEVKQNTEITQTPNENGQEIGKQTTKNISGKPKISYNMYLETDKFHTDGNAAYLNEYVYPDTKKNQVKAKPTGNEEKILEQALNKAEKYTTKLNDLGKLTVLSDKTKVRKFSFEKDGETINVYVNDKYLLDKKDIELYSNGNDNLSALSIRKNGKQIGVVMPIKFTGDSNLNEINVPKIKVSKNSKPSEKLEASNEENQEVEENKKNIKPIIIKKEDVPNFEKDGETNGISIQQLIDEEAPTILNQSENSPEASTSATPKLDAYIDNLLKEFDNLPENYSDTEEIDRMLSEIDILSKLQSNDDLSDEELQKANELVNELEAADWIDEVREIRANNKYNFETNHDYMYRTEMTDDAVPIDKIKQIKEGFEQSSRTVNTDTPEFKRWFGDSKVVDENGKPLKLTDNKNIYIVDGYSNNGISTYTYKGGHRAPSYSGGDVQSRIENSDDVNLEEVAQGFHNQPDDYFSPVGARYYMYDDKEGMESAKAVRDITSKIKNGNKNIKVKIYRAVPDTVLSNRLKNGDWITLSKSYAEKHGKENLNGDYKIIEDEVPINKVWWDGNDIREWGYDNGKEQEPDLYVSIQNPKYQENIPSDWHEARKIRDAGYDGIITPDNKYMVFEKTQIKSVDNQGTFDSNNPNIYYQSAMLSDINPKKEVDVVDLTDKFANDSNLSKDALSSYIKSLIGTQLHSADKKAILNFVSRSKRIGKDNVRVPEHIANSSKVEKIYKGERNTAVNNIVGLIENSTMIEIGKNKDTNKPNVDNYIRFYVPVKIGNDIYTVRIVAENNIKNDLFNIKSGNVYDVIIDKKMPIQSTIKNNSSSSLTESTSDNSITDNNTNFKITIEEMLKNVEDMDEKPYLTQEQETVKGSYAHDENTIEFFKTADESTSVHEVGHWLLNTWENCAGKSEEIARDVDVIRDFVGNKGEKFTKEQHEKFSRAFESYIRNGKTATSKLKSVFEKFKRALRAIYKSLKEIVFKNKGKDTYFNEKDMVNINKLFNRIFTTEKDRKFMGLDDVAVKPIQNKNVGKTRETDKGVELYDVDIPEFLKEYNKTKEYKNLDLQPINDLILKGCTQEELLELLPKDLHFGFRDIKGYTFYNLNLRYNGLHSGHNKKTIGINLEKVGNNPKKLVNTLMHEVQHANQEEYYNYLKSKNYLTNDEKIYIREYEKSDRLMKAINKYYKRYEIPIKYVVSPFLDKNKNLTKEEFYRRVNNLKNSIKRDILVKYLKYFDKYLSLAREIDARVEALKYSWGYIDEEREIRRGTDEGYRGISRTQRYRNIGAKIRDRFDGRRGGNYSIEEPTGREVEQSVRDFDINDVDEILEKVKKEPDEFGKVIFTPISSRLDEISPSLKHAIRKFELNSSLAENKSAEIVKPFIEKVSKMDKIDYAKYDLALKNGNKEVVEKINKKYGIENEHNSIKKLLSDIRKEAINSGLDVGEIEEYFPRRVINPSALLEEYSKSSFIKKYLKEIDPENKLSTEEKISKINTALKGYNGAINATSSFVKGRKISEIDKNLNRYYKDSKDALVDYITSMNNAIETRKFFGNSEETLENSIGAFTNNLIENGIIKPTDEVKLKKLLTARFNQRSMHGGIKTIKNIGYITTMGNPLSAVTQLGDFAFSLYKNGIFNTITGLKNSVFKTDKITKKDLGIDRIAQEFDNDCKSGKIVDKVFKLVGLNKIDALGKETFINGAMNRNKKSAINTLNNKNSKEAKEYYNYLHEIFGNETYNVLEDLKNEKLSDNVKYLLFSEISDFQPISLSEMPEAYLKSGNGRIFYMLKTYSIKLLDVYRNETYRQFRTGNKTKAISNFIRLGFYLVLMGVSADKIKDWMLGRESSIGDTVTDNVLKMAMFSKYQLDRSKSEGIGKTVLSNVLFPTGLVDDVWKDVQSVAKDNYEVKDFKTFRNIPVAGKMYYWWLGGGVDIKNKEFMTNRKKEYKKYLESGDKKIQNEIGIKLYKKGYTEKEVNNKFKDFKKSWKASNTKVYKPQLLKAFEDGDRVKERKIKIKMTKNHLPDAEQRRIHDKAWKEFNEK